MLVRALFLRRRIYYKRRVFLPYSHTWHIVLYAGSFDDKKKGKKTHEYI